MISKAGKHSAGLHQEWQLVVLLASPYLQTEFRPELERLLGAGVDSRLVDQLLVRHRVTFAAATNLPEELHCCVPAWFLNTLERRRASATSRALRQFQIQGRLAAGMTKAGIEHRFFKGLALGQLLHSDLAVRQGGCRS